MSDEEDQIRNDFAEVPDEDSDMENEEEDEDDDIYELQGEKIVIRLIHQSGPINACHMLCPYVRMSVLP